MRALGGKAGLNELESMELSANFPTLELVIFQVPVESPVASHRKFELSSNIYTIPVASLSSDLRLSEVMFCKESESDFRLIF